MSQHARVVRWSQLFGKVVYLEEYPPAILGKPHHGCGHFQVLTQLMIVDMNQRVMLLIRIRFEVFV